MMEHGYKLMEFISNKSEDYIRLICDKELADSVMRLLKLDVIGLSPTSEQIRDRLSNKKKK